MRTTSINDKESVKRLMKESNIIKDLEAIASLLRRDSLTSTTSAGSGHPSSCLSCAEIMSTLWFKEMNYNNKNCEDEDNDEFVLSKGHAAPILYSCLIRSGCIKEKINDLRKRKSHLEGHPLPRSIKWIKAATGSLGQGLSITLGMALGARMQGRNNRFYTLLGDGEMAEGSIYEALEFAKKNSLKNVCAIVDCNRLAQNGESIEGHNTESYKRRFEAFGWKTMVVNGHDVEQIVRAINSFKESTLERPFAIIARTIKGKGVSFLEDKEGKHGVALTNEELKKALEEIPLQKMPLIKIQKPPRTEEKRNKITKTKIEEYTPRKGREESTRMAYGKTLAELSTRDEKVLVIDAGVSNSTEAEIVKQVRPEQYIEGFIAEQNMIGVAQGLSIRGYEVFASTFSSFLTRALDQLRILAVSKPRNNLTICGSHCGVSIGQDGVSQMGLEDISLFRALPESIILYPSDATSTKKIIQMIIKEKIPGIKYLRTTRPQMPTIYDYNDKKESFPLGEFKVLKESRDDELTIIGAGITLHESLKAYKELKSKGIRVAIVDLYCIKPLNKEKLSNFIETHGGKCLVVEDHREEGGIKEAVMEATINNNIIIHGLAINGIPHSATKEELLADNNIDYKSIINKVKEITKGKEK